MSLWDLIMCTCGHPRHSHVTRPVKDVFGTRAYEDTNCRHCECGYFLESRISHEPTLAVARDGKLD